MLYTIGSGQDKIFSSSQLGQIWHLQSHARSPVLGFQDDLAVLSDDKYCGGELVRLDCTVEQAGAAAAKTPTDLKQNFV